MAWGISPRKRHTYDLAVDVERTARIFQYPHEFVVVTDDCKERHFPISGNRFETYSNVVGWCMKRKYRHELI